MKDKAKEEKPEKEGGTSMVAPHPLGKQTTEGGGQTAENGKKKLRPVEVLAHDAGLALWEAAGLMRAARWAEGKQVDQKTFDKALAAFRNRPQGGGAITV